MHVTNEMIKAGVLRVHTALGPDVPEDPIYWVEDVFNAMLDAMSADYIGKCLDEIGEVEKHLRHRGLRKSADRLKAAADQLVVSAPVTVPDPRDLIGRLREALKPFAEACERLGEELEDDEPGMISEWGIALRARDFRRAACALASTPAPERDGDVARDAERDVPSEIAAAVMAMPWTRGGTDADHADRYGDVQTAAACVLAKIGGAA